MSQDFKTQLRQVQEQYLLDAGGGISLPVAGAIYWAVLAALSTRLSPEDWSLAAAMLSGAIFPLGILLQKPFGSPFMKSKSPLSGVSMLAVLSINLLWPVHVVVFAVAPEAAPLTLAIGMSLHWPIIGWTYGSRICTAHAIVRVAAVSAIWFALPEARFDLLPLTVAALYLLTAGGLRWEVLRARRRREGLAQDMTGQVA